MSPVYENPWDLELRRVIADRLVEKGDPYGEYVHASLNAEALPPGPERVALEQHAESLLAPHRLEWAGDLAPAVHEKLIYKAGVPWRARLDPQHLWETIGHPAWRTFGLCSIWPERYGWGPSDLRDLYVEEMLCAFANCNATAKTLDILAGSLAPKLVRRLATGRPKALTRVDVHATDVPEFVDALAGPRPGLPRLERVLCRMDAWSTRDVRMLMCASALTGIKKAVYALQIDPECVETAISVGSPLTFFLGEDPGQTIHLDGSGAGELTCPMGDDLEGLDPDVVRVLRDAPFARFTLKVGAWSRTAAGRDEQRALFDSIPRKAHRRPACATHTIMLA